MFNVCLTCSFNFLHMKVILSTMCTSLVGMLKPELGYYLRKRGSTYFAQRSAHGAPPDGHWRFIVLCAELAQNHLYISDIQVSREEMKRALYEAGGYIAMQNLRLDTYNARDVLNLKTTFGL